MSQMNGPSQVRAEIKQPITDSEWDAALALVELRSGWRVFTEPSELEPVPGSHIRTTSRGAKKSVRRPNSIFGPPQPLGPSRSAVSRAPERLSEIVESPTGLPTPSLSPTQAQSVALNKSTSSRSPNPQSELGRQNLVYSINIKIRDQENKRQGFADDNTLNSDEKSKKLKSIEKGLTEYRRALEDANHGDLVATPCTHCRASGQACITYDGRSGKIANRCAACILSKRSAKLCTATEDGQRAAQQNKRQKRALDNQNVEAH